MPNRYLGASYIDSKRINALSAEGERMFCRLLVHVDDFGRCEACPDLLRGKLFARQLDRINEADVRAWVEELASHKLLFLYNVTGQVYLQMNTWEQGRAKTSRYPDPPTSANKCLHVYADENKCPDTDTDTDTDIYPDTDNGHGSVKTSFTFPEPLIPADADKYDVICKIPAARLPEWAAQYCREKNHDVAVLGYKKAVRRMGAKPFRDALLRFVGTVEAGEEPKNRGAAFNSRYLGIGGKS